jgi:hypothetical protein
MHHRSNPCLPASVHPTVSPSPPGIARLACWTALLAGAVLVGCHSRDEVEVDGDSGGVPVTISITYGDEVFAALEPQGFFRPVFESAHHSYFFAPGYFSMRTTYDDVRPPIRAYLLAGDSEGDQSLWYWPLHYGTQGAEVPIRPGHRVTLTLRGEGGEKGQQVIGAITPSAVSGQRVDIVLSASGARIYAPGAPGGPGAGVRPPPPPPSTGSPQAPTQPPPGQ